MKQKTRHRFLCFIDGLGSRLFVMTCYSAIDLVEAFLFLIILAFVVVASLPVKSAFHAAILPFACQEAWAVLAGAIMMYQLIGWVAKSRKARKLASLLSVFFWAFLSFAAFKAGHLVLGGTWAGVFAIASAFVFWRAGDYD